MAGSWKTITPPNTTLGTFLADTMVLLTDGSVLVHNAPASSTSLTQCNEWQRLTPGDDPTQPGGIYNNGVWNQAQSMSGIREYFGSGVLMDGRFYVLGAEYSDNSGNANFLKTGEIFDPQANTWKAIHKPSPAFDFVTGDLVLKQV